MGPEMTSDPEQQLEITFKKFSIKASIKKKNTLYAVQQLKAIWDCCVALLNLHVKPKIHL
jgi:hypothetical protein